MATVVNAPGLPARRSQAKSDSLSTIRDPRSPTDEFPSPRGSIANSPHPDLNIEVATLTNKLISSINHQTHLDDALAATRQELEATQERMRQLETENSEHERLVATGALIKRAELDQQANKLLAKLSEERKHRTSIEKDKKGIEQELENLTTALFEEANEMVAVARKDRETTERRNEQLRNQIKDMEVLLASHQEQLSELKKVMQQMKADQEDAETTTSGPTGPSTPAIPSQGDEAKPVETLVVSTPAVSVEDTPPGPPTSFSQLLSPVLRTDLQSFEDFRSLVNLAKKSAPSSRVNSGSYGGVSIPGLTSGASLPSSGSAQSTFSHTGQGLSSATTPNTPASTLSNQGPPVVPLKETKFYKRALTEDIEPTLRLDTAPGLSWLARRTVINSMCEGTLVIEPMPASTKMAVFSCALCGENRRGPEFTRTHRFRTSENENAQRYPLCSYCLNRMRASCDYLGFLRMVKDGHWRADGTEAAKLAWEESVRLRERMFWARIGGGVIPAFLNRDSPRPSTDSAKPITPYSAPPMFNGSIVRKKLPRDDKGSHSREVSSSGKSLPAIQKASSAGSDEVGASGASKTTETGDNQALTLHPDEPADEPSRQLQDNLRAPLSHASLRESLQPRPRSRAASYEKERTAAANRLEGRRQSPRPATGLNRSPSTKPSSRSDQGLQISIPGGFDF